MDGKFTGIISAVLRKKEHKGKTGLPDYFFIDGFIEIDINQEDRFNVLSSQTETRKFYFKKFLEIDNVKTKAKIPKIGDKVSFTITECTFSYTDYVVNTWASIQPTL